VVGRGSHARSIEAQCYHGQVRIYLDYNATAPPLPEVIATVGRVMATTFGNASSVHTFGQQAKAELDAARTSLARLIGAEPSEIVFTSGGTESDNLAIRGAAEALEPAGRRHIITTAIEHEAVLNTVRALERRGWDATLLPIDQTGVLSPDALREALRPDTALVSVMHANNEIGAVQPIEALAPLVRAAGALFHTDAVQSAGRIPVDVRQLGVDALSLSAHKFGGPKGTGALWIRRGVRLVPHMTGGRQERGRRAGTEDVPALAGMGVAARVAAEAAVAAGPAIARLRDRLEAGILAQVPGTVVNGDRARRVPNTSNISFDGIEAESLLIALDLEGVAISTGSACSSGSLEPSHVLRAMGLPNARARNSLRFSLGPTTTSDEVDFVVEVLPRLVSRLRQLGRPAAAVR
jgi:cysteine desulfurase